MEDGMWICLFDDRCDMIVVAEVCLVYVKLGVVEIVRYVYSGLGRMTADYGMYFDP